MSSVQVISEVNVPKPSQPLTNPPVSCASFLLLVARPPSDARKTHKLSDEPPVPLKQEEAAVTEAKVRLDSRPPYRHRKEKTEVPSDADSKFAHGTERFCVVSELVQRLVRCGVEKAYDQPSCTVCRLMAISLCTMATGGGLFYRDKVIYPSRLAENIFVP
jgi:hypothetical protein